MSKEGETGADEAGVQGGVEEKGELAAGDSLGEGEEEESRGGEGGRRSAEATESAECGVEESGDGDGEGEDSGADDGETNGGRLGEEMGAVEEERLAEEQWPKVGGHEARTSVVAGSEDAGEVSLAEHEGSKDGVSVGVVSALVVIGAEEEELLGECGEEKRE